VSVRSRPSYPLTVQRACRLGTAAAKITHNELGYYVWQRFQPWDPKEEAKLSPCLSILPLHKPSAGAYSVVLQQLAKKYAHDILMILALLPPEYSAFLPLSRKTSQLPFFEHVNSRGLYVTSRSSNRTM
jgi:hypothetical protein